VQLAEGLLERLVHGGGAGLEVDVTPARAEQFTVAHAGADGEQQGMWRLVPSAAARGVEP